MQIRPVGAALLLVDGQTDTEDRDGETDRRFWQFCELAQQRTV